LEQLKICVAYRLNGKRIEMPPVGADLLEKCAPEYIELPGWQESTVGAKSLAALLANAQAICAESRNCARRRLRLSPPARPCRNADPDNPFG
jgi:adenylosuccinate synthase